MQALRVKRVSVQMSWTWFRIEVHFATLSGLVDEVAAVQ